MLPETPAAAKVSETLPVACCTQNLDTPLQMGFS